MRSVLERLASRGAIPVFAVAGIGTREVVGDLHLDPRIRLVDTPRAADVLIVAGAVPPGAHDALAQVHDALSHPRSTVWWRLGAPADARPDLPDLATVEDDDVVDAVVVLSDDLLARRRTSAPPVLPDEDPEPWRGVGPYGQGGKGMTGGVPYGRPMAERADDRDGLKLDQLEIRLGPFFPRLPAGLVLDLEVQGDIIQQAACGQVVTDGVRHGGSRGDLDVFVRALDERVPVAELEVARARSHLRWISDGLLAHELPAIAERTLRLARTIGAGDGAEVRRLAHRLRRTGVLSWSTRDVGVLNAADLEGLAAGPAARAAGLSEDARSDDDVYRALGFAPVTDPAGDAAARWRVRLREAAASLDLAARAGDATAGGNGVVEGPRGALRAGSAPFARLRPLVDQLLVGSEWGDAITGLVSLDLDLDELVAVGAGDTA